MEDLGGQKKPLNYQIMGLLKKLAKLKTGKSEIYRYHQDLNRPKATVYRYDAHPEDVTLGFMDEFLKEIGASWEEAAPVIQDVLAKMRKRRK